MGLDGRGAPTLFSSTNLAQVPDSQARSALSLLVREQSCSDGHKSKTQPGRGGICSARTSYWELLDPATDTAGSEGAARCGPSKACSITSNLRVNCSTLVISKSTLNTRLLRAISDGPWLIQIAPQPLSSGLWPNPRSRGDQTGRTERDGAESPAGQGKDNQQSKGNSSGKSSNEGKSKIEGRRCPAVPRASQPPEVRSSSVRKQPP